VIRDRTKISAFQRILERYAAPILAAYHLDPSAPPLAEACAVLIQSGQEGVVFVCRADDLVATLHAVSGQDWPEFVDYAERRLREQPAGGLLRVVVSCDVGFGQVRLSVLPGATA
jgi:hypothetical protein